MKKIVVVMVLLASSVLAFGQNLDDINDMMGKFQYRQAKAAIDKYLADAGNASKADGWYYKGRIYNSLSKDSTVAAAEALQLKQDAFAAFQKYQQMDAKNTRFMLESPNFASYVDLYNGLFDIGSANFDARNYGAASNSFKAALKVSEYLRVKGYEFNGFRFPVLDTSLVLNVAISEKLAKNDDEAAIYYRRLADANVSKEQNVDVYMYLAEYYAKKNDNAGMQLILDKAKPLYPSTDWVQLGIELELEQVSKSDNREALLAKYQELVKKYPANYSVSYYYATELYNDLYASEKKPANPDAVKTTINETLRNAIANAGADKVNDANMLMARFLYNYAIDYDDSSKKYRGMKPDDVKKRNDFKALYLKKVDEAIPYAEAVAKYFSEQPKLKATQKANYKIVLDILSQLYASKGDTKKSGEFDKRKEDVDKL